MKTLVKTVLFLNSHYLIDIFFAKNLNIVFLHQKIDYKSKLD